VRAVDFSIGFLRRQAAALLAAEEPVPLGVCPACGSEFVQPQAWKELSNGHLFLRLRCPECLTVTSGTFAQERVAEYDQKLVKGKEATLAQYDAVVRHNMAELLQRFQRALELDLISAEDFATSPRRRDPGADPETLRLESIQRR
jgi:hypothetical protein